MTTHNVRISNINCNTGETRVFAVIDTPDEYVEVDGTSRTFDRRDDADITDYVLELVAKFAAPTILTDLSAAANPTCATRMRAVATLETFE